MNGFGILCQHLIKLDNETWTMTSDDIHVPNGKNVNHDLAAFNIYWQCKIGAAVLTIRTNINFTDRLLC